MKPVRSRGAAWAALGAAAAAIVTFPFAFAQQGKVPTFGTTVVVPGGLIGVVYYIPPGSRSLPYFPALNPVSVIYASSLNVPARYFREGYPGVAGRFEWFAIDYSGRFWIDKPGEYQFGLTSDDGSRLYIDDGLIIDNDGVHDVQRRQGRIALGGGIHRIRVSYFQGPRDGIALTLEIAPPGESWRIFSTDEFKPPPDPESWYTDGSGRGGVSPIAQLELRVSPRSVPPGGRVRGELVLRTRDGGEITGLRWKVVVPAQIVELTGGGPQPDSSRVGGAGEAVRCTMEKTYLYACVLAGQEKPMVSGTIATFDFKIHPDAQAKTVTFRIENIVATTVDGRRPALQDAESTVTIH